MGNVVSWARAKVVARSKTRGRMLMATVFPVLSGYADAGASSSS